MIKYILMKQELAHNTINMHISLNFITVNKLLQAVTSITSSPLT